MADANQENATSLLLDYVPKDADSKIFVVLGASVSDRYYFSFGGSGLPKTVNLVREHETKIVHDWWCGKI
eukprot:gene2042-17608_t